MHHRTGAYDVGGPGACDLVRVRVRARVRMRG